MVVSPHLDGVFIALARSRLRFLATVLDGREEATTMGGMIAHPKCAFDRHRDSRRRPDLPAEAERFGSLCQQPWQLRSLLFGQFRRSSWRRLMTQRFWTLGLATAYPLADRSLRHSQGLRDLFLWPSLLIQFPGTQASAFAPIFRQRCACLHTSDVWNHSDACGSNVSTGRRAATLSG